MDLGFVSAILPNATRIEVFDLAAEIGFDCVELCCWPGGPAERRYAGVTHLDVSRLTDQLITDVQREMRDAGVRVSGLGYYPNPLSPVAGEAEAAVAHIRLVIDAAARLGIGRMNTFIGRDWTRSVDENWPRFLATWTPLIRFAEERDVKIGIENCPMLFGNDEWPGGKNLASTPEIWTRMFGDIPSEHFGLNFDPSHLIWLHMDYLTPLRTFREKLFHIHAKDVRIDQAQLNNVGIMAHPSRFHTPKLPGLGDVNWGRFFSVLTDCGYRGPVCVEVEDRAYEATLSDRRAALVQSHTFLRNFVPAAN